jgi:hypothetical protein
VKSSSSKDNAFPRNPGSSGGPGIRGFRAWLAHVNYHPEQGEVHQGMGTSSGVKTYPCDIPNSFVL